MSSVILHILCEGQTEERFVKDVLSPYFRQFQIFPKPVLLVTSKKKSARGGMLSYMQAKHDLSILIRQFRNSCNETHLYTTMFDYYALPDDFPGFIKTKGIADVRQRVSLLEKEFLKDIGNESFLPYIQLHEFETLLYADISKLSTYYPLAKAKISKLKSETDKYGDPELINDSPETAPSKRIINALKNDYNYNKVQSGSSVASDIGIEVIIERCVHFKDWIDSILELVPNFCK